MAISDNYVPIRQLGNGVTTQFSGLWAVLAAAYLAIFFEDAVTGIQTPVTTGFTLIFDDSGFTVTFSVAPPNTEYVVIGRSVEIDQTDPYRTAKGYQGEVLEASLDKLTAISQDHDDEIARSLKFKLGSLAIGALPDPVNGFTLIWSGTSGALINGPSVGDISNAAANAAITTANAAQTSADVISANAAADVAQAAAAGIKYKASARASTTGILPNTPTYNNGSAGVGATLTASANAALATQDGIALLLGDSLLVQNQASAFQNGVYTLTALGSGAAPWVLTRRTDLDQWPEIFSAAVPVDEGTTLADAIFICTSNSGGVVGTTAIVFNNLSAALPNASVSNLKLALAAANTIKANATAGSASPTDLVIAANQFAARSSTGNLVAKAITDAALASVALATAWTSYTPAFVGLGTPSGVQCSYKQIDADTLMIIGRLITGTCTAVGATISLPAGFTTAANYAGATRAGGLAIAVAANDSYHTMIGGAANTTLYFSRQSGGATNGVLGTQLANGVEFTFDAIVRL